MTGLGMAVRCISSSYKYTLAHDVPPDPLIGWGGEPGICIGVGLHDNRGAPPAHTLPPRPRNLGRLGYHVVYPQYKFLASGYAMLVGYKS